MQAPTHAALPDPHGNKVSFAFKLILIVAMIVVVASMVRFFQKKPPEDMAQAEVGRTIPESSEVSPAAEAAPPASAWWRSRRLPLSERMADSSSSNAARAGSNLSESAALAPAPTGLAAARLPELQIGIDHLLSKFEPMVFYRVPLEHGEQLSNTLAQIRSETNSIKDLAREYFALQANAEKDHQVYVSQTQAANGQRRAEASAAMKQLTDLQALYLDRKVQYQRDTAGLQPLLQDSPDVFDKKVILLRKAKDAFEMDVIQFEAAILEVQNQIQATVESLRTQDENIRSSYLLSAQEVVGKVNTLSNRLNNKLDDVNTLIRDYNNRLIRYGLPLPSSP